MKNCKSGKKQLEKDGRQWKKDNFKIKIVNLFRTKKNKMKPKEGNRYLKNKKLNNWWINERKRRGVYLD
jgi:hypothetical protein